MTRANDRHPTRRLLSSSYGDMVIELRADTILVRMPRQRLSSSLVISAGSLMTHLAWEAGRKKKRKGRRQPRLK
jgi:hypothetical protein